MKRRLVTLCVLGLAGCGFSIGFGGQTAFSNLFPDNQQADVANVLAKQPPAQVAKAPRNSSGRPLVVATTYGKSRKVVAIDPARGAKAWEASVAGSSRPVVGGSAVLVTVEKELVALDVRSGRERWRMEPPEGLSYIGAAIDGGVAYVVFGIPGGARVAHVCALDLEGGSRLWSHDVDKPLGLPAARGGFVFIPWDRQNLTILDAASGEEVARLRSTDDVVNFVAARSEGVFYGAKGLYRFGRQSFRGTKADAAHYEPPVVEVPGDPEFSFDAFGQPTGGRNAREKIRFHWMPDVSNPDAVGLANGALYLLYYRFVFAFDAATGNLRWVYRHPVDAEGLQVTTAGIFLAADDGEIVLLRAEDGMPVWKWGSGVELAAVSFDLDGFAPQPNQQPQQAAPLRARLMELILDPDNRLVPIRQYAVRILTKMEEPEITRDLLDIYAQRNTPEALKQVTAMALRERRTGASFLVEALRRHYDYLEQTESYPLTVLAPTLVAMGERSAVAGLVEHLNDHETSVEALKEVVAAINALGDASTVPALREFLVKYHSDSSFRADATPLLLAAEGLMRMGDVGERELLAKLAAESSVIAQLGTKIQELVAAHEADVRRRAEEEERARIEAERAAQASKQPQQAARVVPRYLSPEEVNATLDAKAEDLRTCTNVELQRNPQLASVRVSIVINRDGTVARTSASPGSETLQGCLDRRIRAYRFPTFRDTRMSANYQIRVREVELQAPEQVRPGQQQIFDWRQGTQAPGAGQAAPGGQQPAAGQQGFQQGWQPPAGQGTAAPGFPQGWQAPAGQGGGQQGFPQGWQAPAGQGGQGFQQGWQPPAGQGGQGFQQGWQPPAGQGTAAPGFPQGWQVPAPQGTAAPGFPQGWAPPQQGAGFTQGWAPPGQTAAPSGATAAPGTTQPAPATAAPATAAPQ